MSVGLVAAGGFDERLDFFHQLGEAVERELLAGVTQRSGRMWMHFDQQRIGSHRDGAFAHGNDEIGAANALAGIDDNRAVGFLFDDRDGGEVECVAGVSLEGADAAFAKEQVRIFVGEHIFAREQPLFDLHREAAFEEDGFAGFGGGDEQLEVLRVARADLDDVRVFGDEIGVLFGKQFGDDGQASFSPRLVEQLQSFLAQTLEFVRRGARFERAAAQDGGAGFLDGDRGGENLFLAFDRARPRHHMEFPAADELVLDFDGGIGRVRLATDELESFLYGVDAFDLRPRGECIEGLVGAFIADGADDGAGHAAHDVRAVTELADFVQHGRFLSAGDSRLENDDHNFLFIGGRGLVERQY